MAARCCARLRLVREESSSANRSSEESAPMRARLERELAALRSPEDLIAWAARVLLTKDSLQSNDASAIEQAFEDRLAGFERERGTEPAKERSDPDNHSPSSDAPSEAVGDLKIPK